jgi:hypothetical protein
MGGGIMPPELEGEGVTNEALEAEAGVAPLGICTCKVAPPCLVVRLLADGLGSR